MKLIFTGQQPTSFMAFPYLGEVEPGEFEARDVDAKVLLQRIDIESAGDDSVQGPELEPSAEPETPVASKPRKASAAKSSGTDEPAADKTPAGK